jgi:MYXO-CTERM domain-containing protein
MGKAWQALVLALAILALAPGACTPTAEPEPPPSETREAAAVIARLVHTFGSRLPRPVEPHAHAAVVALPATADGALSLRDPRTGVGLHVTLVGARPALRRAADGYAVYPRALADGDLVHRATAFGTEDWIALDGAERESAIRYRIELVAGARALRLVGGVLEVLDAGGAPRLRAGPATVFDTQGRSLGAQIRVEDCPVDTSPAPPWNRAVLAVDGACTVAVDWSRHGVHGPVLIDPPWETTEPMAMERHLFHLTTLDSGLVLAAGAENGTTTELYDPGTGTWATTGDLTIGRIRHAQTLLADGRVLVTGAVVGAGPSVECEAYDPVEGTWSEVGDMGTPRRDHVAVRLLSGQVLVAGGFQSGTTTDTAELFDPVESSFSPTDALDEPRATPAATLLADGTVLVAGGDPGNSTAMTSAERFDPSSGENGEWTPTGSLALGREQPVAALVAGKVIVLGGQEGGTNAVEIYDPALGTWSPAPNLVEARNEPLAVLLADGRLLIAGGESNFEIIGSSEIYDPVRGIWGAAGDLVYERYRGGAALLGDGRVLVAGGLRGLATLDSAELFELGADGTACTLATPCSSGHCVDGVCCDEPCDGLCESCRVDVTGVADGVCAAVIAGTAPDGDCSIGASCEQTEYCDGGGRCAPAAELCAPYQCNGEEGCHTSCAEQAHCVPPARCTATGQCELPCIDDVTARTEAGAMPCAPFRCDDEAGGCLDACSSIDDCAPPNLCTEQLVCAAPPDDLIDQGCGCRARGAGDVKPRWMMLALLALVRLRRQKRSWAARVGLAATIQRPINGSASKRARPSSPAAKGSSWSHVGWVKG